MTEIFPVGGIVCEEGHLHWPTDQAYVEVLRPHDHQPAQPGEVGVLVITHLFYHIEKQHWFCD